MSKDVDRREFIKRGSLAGLAAVAVPAADVVKGCAKGDANSERLAGTPGSPLSVPDGPPPAVGDATSAFDSGVRIPFVRGTGGQNEWSFATIGQLQGALDDRYGIYSVKDPGFGAKGDGITDDTRAIQAALAAVPTQPENASIYASRGAVVLFPPGTYIVSSRLTIPRGTTLMGAGSEATELRYTRPSGDVLFYERPKVPLSMLPTTRIKGLRVTIANGIAHTNGAGVHIDSADPSPNMGSRIEIDDVQVWFAYDGFFLRNIQGGSIRFANAHYGRGSGFVFRGFSTMLHVEGCWASAFAANGWDISGWSYCSAVACGSDANGASGWLVKHQPGDGSMYANSFEIGSEQSPNLFTFDGLNSTRVVCFGMARVAPPYSHDGIVVNNCPSMLITPHLNASGKESGYGLRIEGARSSLTVLGGAIESYGVGKVSGGANASFINFGAERRTAL